MKEVEFDKIDKAIRMSTILVLLIAWFLPCWGASPSGTLPVMHINTDGGVEITSKETYIDASYYLDPMGWDVEAIGTMEVPMRMQIRGRGNYTWKDFEKKPYRLKLADKQPLIGMHKSKHFALLAHADDTKGFMRNPVGFELSRRLGLAWTPEDHPVEVVLNGKYIGLYFLTETIRVDNDRVNISEQQDNAVASVEDPYAVTGGWLVEKDNYNTDPHVTIWEDGQKFWFTYKSPEILSAEQTEYLEAQLNAITDALYSSDKASKGWAELVDAESLARFYIIQELMNNTESMHGSCYIFKDKDSDGMRKKWTFGPVWDFGSSFIDYKDRHFYEYSWSAVWIKEAMKFPWFRELVSEIWLDFLSHGFPGIYDFIRGYASDIAMAAVSDADAWNGKYDTNRNEMGKAEEVVSSLCHNAKWMCKEYGGELAAAYNWQVWFEDDNCGWEPVKVYMWTNGNSDGNVFGGWPGKEMEPCEIDGKSGYTIRFSSDIDLEALHAGIIFNNGHSGVGTNQTEDLEFVNLGVYDAYGLKGVRTSTEEVTMETALRVQASGGVLTIWSPCSRTVVLYGIDGSSRMIELHEGLNSISGLPRGIYMVERKKIVL